jgi:putative membrane protein
VKKTKGVLIMNQFLGTLPNFLAYTGVLILLLIVGLILFELTTKNREFKLIAEGNVAAALSIGGRLFGLAFVLGAAAANSISLQDMIIWGIIGILAQIILFLLLEGITLIFAKMTALELRITKSIDENNIAVGTLILMLSLSLGWVIAQALTY